MTKWAAKQHLFSNLPVTYRVCDPRSMFVYIRRAYSSKPAVLLQCCDLVCDFVLISPQIVVVDTREIPATRRV
jgi:hypothetical protein